MVMALVQNYVISRKKIQMKSRNRNDVDFAPDEFQIGETLKSISIDLCMGIHGPETVRYFNPKVIKHDDDNYMLIISAKTYVQTCFSPGAGFISQQRWWWKTENQDVKIGVNPPPDDLAEEVTLALNYDDIRQVIFHQN